MEVDLQFLVDALKSQGIVGSLLLAAIYVIYRLALRYDALQEKRVAEGLENYKIIANLTQAIKDLADLQREDE